MRTHLLIRETYQSIRPPAPFHKESKGKSSSYCVLHHYNRASRRNLEYKRNISFDKLIMYFIFNSCRVYLAKQQDI